MRFIKPALIFLSFCVLGVALGVAAFYLQRHFFVSSPTATTGTVKTASSQSTPKSTPTPANHFVDAVTKVGIDFPTSVLLQPLTLTGYSSAVTVSGYSLLQLQDQVTADTTDTEVYILTSDSATAFATAKSRLQRSVLTAYATQTSQVPTTSGKDLTYKQFSATSASSYEYLDTSLYILVYKDSQNGSVSISDNDLEKIVKSIKLNTTTTVSASATASPTASASSAYLLQSN